MNMNINYRGIFVLLLFSIFCNQLQAITLVFNMRIRRAFNINLPELLHAEKKSFVLATVLPIIYKRDRDIVDSLTSTNVHEKRLIGGSLFNIRYIPNKHWWAEVTTGLEHESVKSRGTRTFSDGRTGFDDIVLVGGYNIFMNDAQIVFFGLTGFPTRTKVTLHEVQDTFVGTRFFSAGVGTEFSYGLLNTIKNTFILIFQNRFLHFFTRKWQPILPAGGKIQPGNVIDLLFSARYRHTKNIFETGYNATIFTNQAVLLKERTIPGKNFVRHSVYWSYTHLTEQLAFIHRPGAIGVGFLTSRADRFNTKIISGWLNLSAVF